jgi:sarcosine oxidase
MIGDPDSPIVQGSMRSAHEHNLPHQILDAAEVHRRFPVFTPATNEIALYEEIGGMVYPEAAIRAHVRGAIAAGAELHFEEPVISWEASPSDDRVRVTTAQGTYEAERLVIAAGAYAPALLEGAGLPLTVKRNILYWFKPTRDAELFAPERCPIYIWDPVERPSFYGFPIIDGSPAGVKVAFHNFGPLCAPETIDRQVYPEEIARMRAWLASRMPAIADGELTGTATCMYTLTPDEDFLIDAHPQHPQILICSPCSGHGYKFASVVGEIMADMAQKGVTAHPIGKFSAGRFVG